MSIRDRFDDLMWRVLRPTLADVWDEGYQAGAEAESDAYWGGPTETPNPYRENT